MHDWDYGVGRTLEEKQAADCRLLHNLYIMIESADQPHLEALRKNRAQSYYEAVAMGGKGSFGHGPIQEASKESSA